MRFSLKQTTANASFCRLIIKVPSFLVYDIYLKKKTQSLSILRPGFTNTTAMKFWCFQ